MSYNGVGWKKKKNDGVSGGTASVLRQRLEKMGISEKMWGGDTSLNK